MTRKGVISRARFAIIVCAPYERDSDLVDTELFDQLGDQVEGCAKSVIATGEQRIYANLLLTIGVVMPQHLRDEG